MHSFGGLLRYTKKYWVRYALGILMLFVVDYAQLFIPQATGEITDGLQNSNIDPSGIAQNVIKIIFFAIIVAAGRFSWRFFIFGSARRIEYDIRNSLFKHLESLPLNFYNKNKTGDLMAHFTNDLNAVRMAIGPGVITAFDAMIMTVMVLSKMILYVDWKLTALALIPFPLIAVGSIFFGKAIRKRFEVRQQAFSLLSDQVQESVSGVRVIKAFVQESNELVAFARVNKNYLDKNMRVVRLFAIVYPCIGTIIGISTLVALVYGGYITMIGEISLGKFIAFNQYIGMLVWPMIAIGETINIFSQGIASNRRLNDIFIQKSEITESTESTVTGSARTAAEPDIKGAVSFRDLRFAYVDTTENVIDGMSFEIEKGSTCAIFGRTGSGKTTLVNLLLRLYNPGRNQIFFDGIDILDIPVHTLREAIAYVPQDNFLFSDSIANNVAFAGVGGTDAIINATTLAGVHDNIKDLPEGYDTIVGERGVTLSGGQKQRVSIARAIIKDAPILILDDSLSAVDTDTEEKILQNIKKERAGKTTIMIAHRISTIQNADRIIVIKDGTVAESGNHQALIEHDGIYAATYRRQQLESRLEEDNDADADTDSVSEPDDVDGSKGVRS